MRDRLTVRFDRWRWVLASLCAAGSAPGATAEAERLPVALEYSAIESCPSQGTFWAALESRSTRVDQAPREQATAVLQVNIILTAQGVLGRLQIVRDGVITEPRFVEAANCEQVVQALALTAALSVEAETLTAETPSSPPPPMPPEEYSDRTLDDARLTRSDGDEWQARFGAALTSAFVVNADVQAGLAISAGLLRHRELLPSQVFELSLGYSRSSQLLDVQADFRLIYGEFAGCLFTFDGSFSSRPCFLIQGGALNVNGRDLSNSQTSSRMWWAPGLGIQVELPKSSPLQFQVAVNVLFPLAPQVYELGQPATTIAETLPISPWLSVGAVYAQ